MKLTRRKDNKPMRLYYLRVGGSKACIPMYAKDKASCIQMGKDMFPNIRFSLSEGSVV